ncbi:hypothetical protein F4677DRAFT_423885 [Hypoxylon crocopeplum]|nr:hypothetical protein F4677DRAFT_423885 [Hypoxylon crocopeplum]
MHVNTSTILHNVLCNKKYNQSDRPPISRVRYGYIRPRSVSLPTEEPQPPSATPIDPESVASKRSILEAYGPEAFVMPVAGLRAARQQLCQWAMLPKLLHPSIPIYRPSSISSTHLLPLRTSRLFGTSRKYSSTGPFKTQDPILVDAALLPRPRRQGLYYAAIFLLVGVSLGTLFKRALSPPPPPTPGSAEDHYLVSKIEERGSSLAIVRELSADPAWTSWDAYSGLRQQQQSAQLVQSRMTSGPLSGSRGLAFQRVFHNARTGEVVSVVYFGSATSGWPGIVHGGALATVLDESLGRCAILKIPARTGVTARLELTYRAPTLTTNYYVIRARPLVGQEMSDRKMWVEGTLETDNGKVCVEAKALFVVPKGVKLKPLVEGF